MEQALENRGPAKASIAQRRRAENGNKHGLRFTPNHGIHAGSTNEQYTKESDSEEQINMRVKKKARVSGGSRVISQHDGPQAPPQESSSSIHLSIIHTIEPDSPAAKLDGYAMYLFQHLFQIAKAGKLIHDMRANMESKQQLRAQVDDTLLKDILDLKLRKFIVFACNSVTGGDKLTSHRFVGPSSQRILKYYADSDSCKANLQRFLWHLFIWRLFGFSRLDVIDKFYHATNVEEALEVLSGIDKISKKPLTNIGAYGNFRIPVDKRQKVLNGLYDLSIGLARKLMSQVTFITVQETIEAHNVLYLQRDRLLAWLVGCDLAEWNLCTPPTVEDLIHKIGSPPFEKGKKSKGGAGTLEALFVVQNACKMEFPFKTSEQLQAMLTQVLDALRHAVGDECREMQNRELSMADIEHMLCKISRASKIIGKKNRDEESDE